MPRRSDQRKDSGQMANELQRPDSAPGVHDAGAGNQAGERPQEPDPDTWYGLVWRIVRIAMESNANLVRVSVLLVLLCGVLWFVESIVRLGEARPAPTLRGISTLAAPVTWRPPGRQARPPTANAPPQRRGPVAFIAVGCSPYGGI